jgi:hypothetical protein
MIYFDSDMSKSTNTVVYFDWKTLIYIYFCGKCHTQFMMPMEKLVTFTGACTNEIIPNGYAIYILFLILILHIVGISDLLQDVNT